MFEYEFVWVQFLQDVFSCHMKDLGMKDLSRVADNRDPKKDALRSEIKSVSWGEGGGGKEGVLFCKHWYSEKSSAEKNVFSICPLIGIIQYIL